MCTAVERALLRPIYKPPNQLIWLSNLVLSSYRLGYFFRSLLLRSGQTQTGRFAGGGAKKDKNIGIEIVIAIG